MVQLGEKDQGCKMISGIKRISKANKSVLQKLSMSKKNSSVNLKSSLNNKDLSDILNFKKLVY